MSSPAIDRRRFVSGLAAVVGAAALDGCGTPASGRARPLRISQWPLYIDNRTIPDFQRATGIAVQYTQDINDNNEFFAKIEEPLKRGQSIDRDLIVLTDWVAGKMIRRGLLAPLDDRRFPNKVNLVDFVRDVDFDPDRRFTVPWFSGMVGIGYDRRRVGRDLTSVEDVFDPRFRGRVTMLTEMRDTLGLVLLGMGKDPATCTVDDARLAAARIADARQSGQIRAFTGNDYADDLASGNILIAFAWSGDIQGLRADNPDLQWIAPREGAILFSDNMMIPKTSDRQDLAMAWINWCYDPAHSAQIVSGAPYISDVKGAGAELAKIAPALAGSELVNPPPELVARLHVFRTLSDAEEAEFNRVFQRAIGA